MRARRYKECPLPKVCLRDQPLKILSLGCHEKDADQIRHTTGVNKFFGSEDEKCESVATESCYWAVSITQSVTQSSQR